MLQSKTALKRVAEYADRHPALEAFVKTGRVTPEFIVQINLIHEELEAKSSDSTTALRALYRWDMVLDYAKNNKIANGNYNLGNL